MHVRWNIPSWPASLSIRRVVCSCSCVRRAVAFNNAIEGDKLQDIPLKILSLCRLRLWFQMHLIRLNTPTVSLTLSLQEKKGKVGTLSQDVWQQQKARLFKWLINAAYNNLWSSLDHLSRVDLGAVSVEIYWTKARWLISYQRLSLYKGGSLGWSSFSPCA